MAVIRTFVSYAQGDRSRVNEILERAAPYGVCPWQDEHDLVDQTGASLAAALRQAIDDPSCPSLTLFLSAESARSGWVQAEVGEALGRVPQGQRILPILLDPPETLVLPEVLARAMRQQGDGSFDTLYLRGDAPELAFRWAKAVLAAGGVDKAKDLVLHLGHREPARTLKLPEVWQPANLPAIELRFRPREGDTNWTPSAAEWQQMWEGLQALRKSLSGAERIRVVGRAPLGVAAMVGKTWDRGSGIDLAAWNEQRRELWRASALRPGSGWTPETARHVRTRAEDQHGNFHGGQPALTVALIQKPLYWSRVDAWNRRAFAGQPLLFLWWPDPIGDRESPADEVLTECLGAIEWVRTRYPDFKRIDFVTTLPLALVALLAHHLRQMGWIRFWDWAAQSASYTLALEWHR